MPLLAGSFEFRGWQIAGDHCSQDGIRWSASDVLDGWRPGLIDQWSILKHVPLGDRLVFLTDDLQTTRSHPVPLNPVPHHFWVVDRSYVESPVNPALEYRLNYFRKMGDDPWTQIGDWQSAGGPDPYLFWATGITDSFGFYRMETREKE